MLRVDRRGGTWKLLGSVVMAHRQELVTTIYIGFLSLITSSFIMYLLEKDAPNTKIKSYAESLWWGVITWCTIGYGDIIPVTWPGKLLASMCALGGISFFALPAGILGSGFALKVQAMQRQKHLNRRRVPAVNLIQSLWRCYAADDVTCDGATWKIYRNKTNSQCTVTSNKLSNFITRATSFRKRTVDNSEPTLKDTSVLKDLMIQQFNLNTTRKELDFVDELHNNNNSLSLNEPQLIATDDLIDHLNPDRYLDKKSPSIDNRSIDCTLFDFDSGLTNPQIIAIRAIRKLKYLVARRKFREALRPYDVTDVIEQYSAGNLDMLTRIKSLQLRIDKILGSSKSKDSYDYTHNLSLANCILNIEKQVEQIDCKFNNFILNHNIDMNSLVNKLNRQSNSTKDLFKDLICQQQENTNRSFKLNMLNANNRRKSSQYRSQQRRKRKNYRFIEISQSKRNVLLSPDNLLLAKQLEIEAIKEENNYLKKSNSECKKILNNKCNLINRRLSF
jgi:potassium voltage-gated channel KQT-like subfamily member 5